FFASASRSALSWTPASFGYDRSGHRWCSPLLNKFQNIDWLRIYCSIPRWIYVDDQKDDADFPGDRCIHYSNASRIFQRSSGMAGIQRSDLLGSYNNLGFRVL